MKISELLATLSQQELREVQARVAALLSEQPAAATASDATRGFFELLGHVAGVTVPYSVAQKSGWWPKLQAVVPSVDDFVNTHFKPLCVADVKAARIKSIKAVLHALETWGVPATPGNIVAQLSNLRACFDVAFPGYAAAGMLKVLLDRPLSV